MEPLDIHDALTRTKLLASRIERWSVAQRLTDEQAAIRRMGIDLRIWRRAVCARTVSADAHLAICNEIGVDAVTLAPPSPAQRLAGPVHWHSLGIALRMEFIARGHSVRNAAAACSISAASISRAANGHAMSFDALARLSAYVRQHPHAFTHPPMGAPAGVRSTGNTDCNTLNKQGVNHA